MVDTLTGWDATVTPAGGGGFPFTFGASQFSDIGGAVSDIFSGMAQQEADETKAEGARIEAQNYGMAAKLASENAQYATASAAVKTAQEQRQLLMVNGASQAAVAGAGFANSGSALDIMRMNAAQGALTSNVLQFQGAVTTAGYQEQSASYTNLQKAATLEAQADEQAASDSMFGGIIGAVTKVASAVGPIALAML